MRHEPVQALSASAMLELWEQGAARDPLDQALLFCVTPAPHRLTRCEWTIGQRDACVLELRQQTLGDRIEAYAECPACRNGFEFELSCTALLASASDSDAIWTTVEQDGRSWELRRLNSRDLALAIAAADLKQARRMLLSRCVRESAGGTELEVLTEADEAALCRSDWVNWIRWPKRSLICAVRCVASGGRRCSISSRFSGMNFTHEADDCCKEIDLLARTWVDGRRGPPHE